MKRLDKLTIQQEQLIPVIRDKWINRALSGDFDKDEIKTGVNWLYESILKKERPKVVICGCPYEAILTILVFKGLNRDNIGANIRDNIGDNIWDNIGANIWDNIRDNIGANIWDNIGDNIWANIGANIGDNIWANIRANIRANIWANIGANIRDNIGDNIWANIGANIWANIRANIRANIWANIGDIFNERSGYCDYSDYSFCAWADYFEEVGLACVTSHKYFKDFKKLIWSNPFMSWFYEGYAFIVKPPVVIDRNESGQLHSLDRAAIEFENGTKMYFIRGRAMPSSIFEEEITLNNFMSEDNEDVRAGMYELLEAKGKFLEMVGAECVDSQTVVHKNGYTEEIKLFKTKEVFKGTIDGLTGDTDVQLCWLNLTCPSTGQKYMIPSFPSIKTALEAAKYHRPEGVPLDLPYQWHSAS